MLSYKSLNILQKPPSQNLRQNLILLSYFSIVCRVCCMSHIVVDVVFRYRFSSMLHVEYCRIIDVVFIYRLSCMSHIVVDVVFLYRFYECRILS